jgi:hypothetical protein
VIAEPRRSAIYSTATSSHADAPRGMEFLYSLNRLNVVTSRAKCVSILVGWPQIFEADCRTPRQIQLANATPYSHRPFRLSIQASLQERRVFTPVSINTAPIRRAAEMATSSGLRGVAAITASATSARRGKPDRQTRPIRVLDDRPLERSHSRREVTHRLGPRPLCRLYRGVRNPWLNSQQRGRESTSSNSCGFGDVPEL